MTKRPYTKPATTYAQQLAKLRERGMDIADEDAAKFYLQHINYYRLSGYWLPFEADHTSHRFRPGASFDDVLNLYVFDRELRLLFMDAIERIEISARAQWAYRVGHLHGSHAHLDRTIWRSFVHWRKNIDDLAKEVGRADEIFIKHLTATYSEQLPPIWAACEVMSLGLLSRWYANIKPMNTRSLIANTYRLDSSVFGSWLHHLSVVRNICAHHSRLWNRDFSRVPPAVPQKKPAVLVGEFVSSHKLYNTLLILLYFMDLIAPYHHWRSRLKNLLVHNGQLLKDMGFPDDWEGRRIWHGPALP